MEITGAARGIFAVNGFCHFAVRGYQFRFPAFINKGPIVLGLRRTVQKLLSAVETPRSVCSLLKYNDIVPDHKKPKGMGGGHGWFAAYERRAAAASHRLFADEAFPSVARRRKIKGCAMPACAR